MKGISKILSELAKQQQVSGKDFTAAMREAGKTSYGFDLPYLLGPVINAPSYSKAVEQTARWSGGATCDLEEPKSQDVRKAALLVLAKVFLEKAR